MLKIVVPENMNKVLEHLQEAGRTARFENGRRLGRIEETGDLIVRIRSGDIPLWVADSCDIGLCGSDWVEERERELGIKLEVLNLDNGYRYGRESLTSPTLDLVTLKDDGVSSASEIADGALIATEYPLITRVHFEEKGKKVAVLGREASAPTEPGEFRHWCQENGRIAFEVVHGGIAEHVSIGAGYGVMVNESGGTLRKNDLRTVETIREVRILLIADPQILRVDEKEKAVESLYRDLERAYLTFYGESEENLNLFKERGR